MSTNVSLPSRMFCMIFSWLPLNVSNPKYFFRAAARVVSFAIGVVF